METSDISHIVRKVLFQGPYTFLLLVASILLSITSVFTIYQGLSSYLPSIICIFLAFAIQSLYLVSSWVLGSKLTNLKVWPIWGGTFIISVFFSYSSLYQSVSFDEEFYWNVVTGIESELELKIIKELKSKRRNIDEIESLMMAYKGYQRDCLGSFFDHGDKNKLSKMCIDLADVPRKQANYYFNILNKRQQERNSIDVLYSAAVLKNPSKLAIFSLLLSLAIEMVILFSAIIGSSSLPKPQGNIEKNIISVSVDQVLFHTEIILVIVSAVLSVQWIIIPSGNYEPYIVLSGLGIGVIDMLRRILNERRKEK